MHGCSLTEDMGEDTPFPSTRMPGTQQPPCTHLTWNMRCEEVMPFCHTLVPGSQAVMAKDKTYIRHCLRQN